MDFESAKRICEIAGVIDANRWPAIFQTAGTDARRCASALAAAASGNDGPKRIDQFWARASVRAFFAMVEAMTFEMRLALRQALEANLHDLPVADRVLIHEQTFELDESGRPQGRPRFLAVDRNFRFAFSRFTQLFGVATVLDVRGEGWHKFLQTIKVRNRITHPKAPEDMNLTAEEATMAMQSISWYSAAMTSAISEIESRFIEATARVKAGP